MKNTKFQIILSNDAVAVPPNHALVAVQEGKNSLPFVGLFLITQASIKLMDTFKGYSKTLPKGALKHIRGRLLP